MEPLTVRELKHVQTLVFAHTPEKPDVVTLLDLVADYLDASGGTLLSLHYSNEDEEDGTYRESLTVFVECPYAA